MSKKASRIPPSLRLLANFFAPYKPRLAAGIACLFVANMVGLISPLIVRALIDGLTAEATQDKLLGLSTLVIVLAVGAGVLLFFQRRLVIGIARDMEYKLRNDFYAHLQKLPPEFYQTNRTGDLMARATSDLAVIRTLSGLGLIATFNALFALTLILPLMISVNWRLTGLSFLPLPLLAVLSRSFSKRIRQRAGAVQESYGRLSSSAQETLTGVRVARAYGQQEAEIVGFEGINTEYMSCNLALIQLSTIFRFVLQFAVGVGFILVFLYGGYLITQRTITIGQFIQQTLYLGLLVGPIASLGFLYNLYQRAMASLTRIQDIMSLEPAIRDRADALVGTQIKGDIEFRNLTFKYPSSDQPVLKGVNLTITSGQIVALVGPVGSGKSTLMNLACRLLEAEKGQVLLDGKPIQEIPLQTLRSAIGYVPQETVLFSETVAANIAFGVDECSPEAIARVSEEAALTDDVTEFPLGFETLVGERGLALSGGQGQRVAIARALLCNPKIVIFDDALSAVDTHTEEAILTQLRKGLSGRTTFIASHRLSTVKNADLIVVLHEGCVVQSGMHHQLLASGGYYADLYEKQLLEAELISD